MKVNVKELYILLQCNLSDIELYPKLLVPGVDSIEIEPKYIESGRNIRNVLINPSQSPYLWRGYNGVPMRMTFYTLCFFSFFSGVMYSVIKNNNRISHWNYWDMHKRLGSDFLLQCLLLDRAIVNRNSQQIDMIKGDTDIEGIQMYSIVHWIIYNYFESKGIRNFPLFDEQGLILEPEIDNLEEVLSMFHKTGCDCSQIARYGDNDCRLSGKRIWGGNGMSQMFNYIR